MSDELALSGEALRQQQMLQVLWRQRPADALTPGLAGTPEQQQRGWQAYQANAAASADRVLAGIYPVLAACVGEQAMAVLARQAWRQSPPCRGDLDDWAALGDTMPRLLAEAPPLLDQPWLSDLARLEWCVHLAERATDASDAAPAGLERLGGAEGPASRLQFRPGTALVRSPWPVATQWQAHAADAATAPARLQQAWPGDAPEAALVLRRGWRATVQALGPADADFTAALLAGQPLHAALDAVAARHDAAGWSVEAWLMHALRQGWIIAVTD
jgi:hypothetical protein